MIFLLFIFIPIIEIAIFITVGSNIGILNTIAIILLTAIVGIFFVRRQGLSLLFNAQRNMSQGIMPTEEIKGGIFLLISGLLLITPGFFTDCIGFAMFLKPVQNFISKQASNYFRSRIRK
ncbi:MAG: FxsA family protein [Alphaproteobacteria bacterium]|nr:FxsA family protein [Alphaproteobacteria bacterium]